MVAAQDNGEHASIDDGRDLTLYVVQGLFDVPWEDLDITVVDDP
jgi:hypothetical protein